LGRFLIGIIPPFAHLDHTQENHTKAYTNNFENAHNG